MAKELQLAEILSDLVSLSPGVCDPAAALALVSARPSAPDTASSSTATAAASDDNDADLVRAKQLVALHYKVRERCKSGELGKGLDEARRAVESAVGA